MSKNNQHKISAKKTSAKYQHKKSEKNITEELFGFEKKIVSQPFPPPIPLFIQNLYIHHHPFQPPITK
jgi:hypothetical protein